jgi:hypothetical protein
MDKSIPKYGQKFFCVATFSETWQRRLARVKGKGKGKAIPLQAWTGPEGCSRLRLPIENWTHVYINLFTGKSPYYHLLKYLLFLLKHPVYYLV